MNILELAILKKMVGGGGGSGTDNYNDLSNLPQINGETLAGNKTAENLGLQDALTFDSTPTEDSTNPVESGGVFNALAGKQDNLTFDGTYDASTNKAATESTVTDAINELDVSETSFDADETIDTISETDGKIAVTKKDIAIASNQVTSMTGYTKPSSAPATPAIQTNDTANQAFGKLEFKADTNQTNIWYTLETGANNLCPESQLTIISNSKTKSLTVNLPAGKYYISCNATLAGNILADGVLKNSAGTAIGTASGFANGANVKSITIADTATVFYFYSTDANASFDNLMIVPEVVWNAIDHNFRTAAISNADLTKLEAEDRAGLIECVDEGAKNIFKTFEASEITTVPATIAGLTFIRNADGSITLNGTNSTGSDVFIKIGVFNYEAGKEYAMGYSCIKDGNVNKAYAYSSDDYLASSYDPIRTHTYSSSGSAYVYIRVASDYQFVNATIYPMICTKAKYDISPNYESHALPNTDLTRMMTPFFTVPINHNMIYRGQNLGDTLTADQDTALSSGNFTDLYLGDYWTKQITIPAFYEVTAAEPADWSTNYTSYYTKSGDTYTPVTGDTAPTWAANTYYERLVPSQTVTLKAVIADFDTFYAGYASTYAGINSHHAAVVVHGFNNVVWNKTNTTAGGYVNSLIHKWLVGSALPQIETWFGSAKVLSHQKLLTNAITGDAASEWAWSSQKISLLSENQMYGSKVWGNSKAANGGYEPGEAFKHLNVFNHIDANLLFGNKNIWLRDIASAAWVARLNYDGGAGYYGASYTGITPAALILLS